MRRSFALVPVLALGLGLAACGGDGGGAAADDPFVVAARDGMIADEDFPGTDEEAQCLAERIVGAVGTDALEEAGITPEQFADDDFNPTDLGIELDEATAREIVTSFDGCGMSLVDLMVEGMGGGGTVSDELRSCVQENLDEDTFTDLMVQTIVGGESEEPPAEFMSAIFALAAACPELMQLGS